MMINFNGISNQYYASYSYQDNQHINEPIKNIKLKSVTKAKSKKTRTVFSKQQILELESTFYSKRYLSNTDRVRLSKDLSLSENQVKVWFQNRRNKWKRDMASRFEHTKHNMFSTQFRSDDKNNRKVSRENNNNQIVQKTIAICHRESITLPIQSMDMNTGCCYGNTQLLQQPYRKIS